jgi:hypothetical protein
LETHYLSIDLQDQWGKHHPKFYRSIPYDNESRRNIGYLFALENECERIISIDDDNFPLEGDFIGGHLNTGSDWKGSLISDSSGYFNICELLDISPPRPIYPRGYPFDLRDRRNESSQSILESDTKIGATQGLWIGDPDIDATTWINGRVEAISYNGPANFVLNEDTWCPINTQNTSVVRELVPAFFCIPMGVPLPGGKIERYGDIWGGYFFQSIIRGTEYRISFGHPIVEHRRNQHRYLDDLRHEFWGLMLTDWLLQHLREDFKPSAASVLERMMELCHFLLEICSNDIPTWCPKEVNGFIEETASAMQSWTDLCLELQ